MKIIGLTGGIASGKNFVAEIFAKNGAIVFDADQEVHNLLESDESTISEIRKYFPKAIIEEKISRKILGEIVFSDERNLKIIEEILHPKVRKKYQELLSRIKQEEVELLVLNIPLLLESQEYQCDKIIAVIAPKELRKQHFLERAKRKDAKNFSRELKNLEDRFEKICTKQMSDSDREVRADFIINNDFTEVGAISQVKKIIDMI